MCSASGCRASRPGASPVTASPLLNKNIDYLLNSGYDGGIDMGLITNGVYLNRPEYLNRLTYLGVSLDATTAATWSRLKHAASPEDFDKIVVTTSRRYGKNFHLLSTSPSSSCSAGRGRASARRSSRPPFPWWTTPTTAATTTPGTPRSSRTSPVTWGASTSSRTRTPRTSSTPTASETCHATPLGGVFAADHRFHLCCDARSIYVLTDDYTRDAWQELPRLWSGPEHKKLIASINPKKCLGQCAQAQA